MLCIWHSDPSRLKLLNNWTKDLFDNKVVLCRGPSTENESAKMRVPKFHPLYLSGTVSLPLLFCAIVFKFSAISFWRCGPARFFSPCSKKSKYLLGWQPCQSFYGADMTSMRIGFPEWLEHKYNWALITGD